MTQTLVGRLSRMGDGRFDVDLLKVQEKSAQGLMSAAKKIATETKKLLKHKFYIVFYCPITLKQVTYIVLYCIVLCYVFIALIAIININCQSTNRIM